MTNRKTGDDMQKEALAALSESAGWGAVLTMSAALGASEKIAWVLSDAERRAVAMESMGSAIGLAASNGRLEALAVLVQACERQEHIESALRAACEMDKPEAARILLGSVSAKGADSAGFTALMWAAIGGSIACARLVLEDSNLEIQDAYGKTALMHAIENGRVELAALIESAVLARSEARELDFVSIKTLAAKGRSL